MLCDLEAITSSAQPVIYAGNEYSDTIPAGFNGRSGSIMSKDIRLVTRIKFPLAEMDTQHSNDMLHSEHNCARNVEERKSGV